MPGKNTLTIDGAVTAHLKSFPLDMILSIVIDVSVASAWRPIICKSDGASLKWEVFIRLVH